MNLQSLATAPSLENAGVWVPFEDVSFLIAATGRPAYQRSLQAHAKPYARQLAKSVELQTKVAIETMADSVLLDFKGVTNGNETLDGKNRAHRVMVLENRILREFIAGEAATIENYQTAEDAAEVDALKSRD